MLRNLLLTAYRSLNKNKFFTFLNVIGLGIGMAVFLLIALYVRFERSYEDFIPDADNIYRVSLQSYLNNELVFASAENYPGVAPAMRNEFPEVMASARLYNMGYKNNIIITNQDAKPDPVAFKHRRFLYADSSFLPMMGYPMVAGDAKTALAQPFNAVISEKYARMYFGDEDPIGKSLRLQDDDFVDELVKVTGVFKDIPANTHLKFDVLFSYKTLFPRGDWAIDRYDHGWRRKDMYTFIRVRPDADVNALEAKFPALVEKYKPENKERNANEILSLQPIKSIHLTSNLAEEPETNGDDRIVRFMSLIGIFVLIIAWINYVNLSTAKAMERAREVGVRKVMGAFKAQLVRQFLMESAMINLLSILIAVAIAFLVLPYFNALSGLTLTFSSFLEPWFLLLVLVLWLSGTLLSGFYPALVLSSFKPVMVLKGKIKNSVSGILMRKGLVTLQFIASVVLIASTLIVYRQLNFMMSRDLGMNIDQVLVVERPGISPRDRQAFNSSIDVFRNELKKSPGVMGVSASATIPGKQREYKAIAKRYGAPDDEQVTLRFNSMDFDFLNVFKMKLLAGRAFSEQFTNDPDTSVIISESAVKLLGYKNPEEAIGQTIAIPGFQWNPIVTGVVNDYHQVSLKKPLDPSIFYCTAYGGEFYSMRIQTADLPAMVEHVRQSWLKAFPGNPFEYFFLDDYFNKQYENERKFGKLFSTFAVLAVIVGCLGLFGLSAYTASQRTKEIGIRKVLGSSERGIFMLLSKEYVGLVLIAITIAIPLVWLSMNSWITSFPYRTTISATVFLIAGVAVLVLAISTVSFQTLKAAHSNPVDSLRHE
ncbi:MAG: ABC transporter permease [Flammeovirgaceae bacterium]|nr:ABC transporter permease [Flammeovirgaceae bacterium]